MPPAVESSDEGSDGGIIPHTKYKDEEPSEVDETGEEEDGSGSDANADEEGVYVVEKVVNHKFDGKRILLEVKWKGYTDADNTWEPEGNVQDGAIGLLNKYYEDIGGRPELATKGKKKRNLSENGTPESSRAKKKSKRSTMLKSELDTPSMSPAVDFEQPDWVPDKKDWEKELKAIDTIEREGKSGTLFVYLHWNNGRKSKVNIDQCYEKCPRAMLRFYEEHLVFKTT